MAQFSAPTSLPAKRAFFSISAIVGSRRHAVTVKSRFSWLLIHRLTACQVVQMDCYLERIAAASCSWVCNGGPQGAGLVANQPQKALEPALVSTMISFLDNCFHFSIRHLAVGWLRPQARPSTWRRKRRINYGRCGREACGGGRKMAKRWQETQKNLCRSSLSHAM
jgi:hypothetical protein